MKNVEEVINITSLPENIILVEEYVENFCDKHKIDETIYGNILISLTEAVNNAIIHGNKNNADKFVNIIYNLKSKHPKMLTIRVEDEGNGFNYLCVPDPTSPENAKMEVGKGVFLIKQLADVVIFSDKGNSVELQFRL